MDIRVNLKHKAISYENLPKENVTKRQMFLDRPRRSHQFDRYIYQSLQFSTAVHLYYKAVQDRPIVEPDHVILAPAPQSACPAGLVNNRPFS